MIPTKVLGNGSFGNVFPGVDERIKVTVKKIEVSSINSDNLRRECE
jgi:hypothetical protein